MSAGTNHIPDEKEHELMQCLKGSDERHFSKLYDTYSAALFGLIHHWIRNTGVAENLLQDVFVKAWCNRARYDASKGRIFTWLHNIARNVCIDHLRSKAHKQALALAPGEEIAMSLPGNAGGIFPDTIGLRKLVSELREEEKKMIELMYFEGFTQSEIAMIMNMPLGTVKTRINRAIRNLRFLFKKDWKRAIQNISLN